LYAVGGGSVLDLVGLAASIYRRGVPLAKIPTTVMAQVDAAVGLKNAINFEGAKNLVGSFAPPHSVFVDYELLASLPKRHVANGVSEIVKLGLMLDDGLIGNLMALPASRWPDSRREFDGILRNAIAGIVDELSINPYEASLSRPLDFGHWLSPQLEMDDPNLLHGEAVSIDMAITLVMSAHRKLMRDSNVAALLDILDDWGLPTWHPGVTPDLVEDSLAKTCSHRGGQQNIPLCTGIGMHLIVHDISCQEVMAAVQRLGSRLRPKQSNVADQCFEESR
jgi:2-epi-5-epi-valiolone synthase